MYMHCCAYFTHLLIYSSQPMSGHYHCYPDLTDEEIKVHRFTQNYRASWRHSWALNPYLLLRNPCS